MQLHLFGKVNDNITFDFVPLQQMSETDLSTIRKSDTDRDVAYIQAGVVSAEEVRGRLAGEPDSGYNGIDVEDVPEMPDDGFSDGLNDGEGGEGGEGGDPADPKPEPAQDAEWDESKHPRAENGQFGGGSGGKQTEKPSKGKTDLGSLFQTAISNSGAMPFIRILPLSAGKSLHMYWTAFPSDPLFSGCLPAAFPLYAT